MENFINHLPRQLTYQPTVIHGDRLLPASRFVVCGMGGSHLAASLLQAVVPTLPLTIHRDYGLPHLPEAELHSSLIILSSYSGNTAEVLAAADEAMRRGLRTVAITQGGALLNWANSHHVPYIQLPESTLPPRLALGWSLLACLALLDPHEQIRRLVVEAGRQLNTSAHQTRGEQLAQTLQAKIPVVYSSYAWWPLAYAWKISLNETGKVPAFHSILPEANHNELAGFDPQGSMGPFLNQFAAVLLNDPLADHHLTKRFELVAKFYREAGLTVVPAPLGEEANPWLRIFNSLVLGQWVSFYLAVSAKLEPWGVPRVEEFKNQLG